MVPALDSQSGLFARRTPCLRGVSGVKKANMDARLEALKSNGHDPETEHDPEAEHDPENKHDKERCMTETTNPIDDLNNAAAGMHGFDADTQNRPPQMSGGGIVLVIEDAARKTQLVIDDANAHALWIRSWRTDESRWRTWKLFSSMRQINKTVSARIADALEAAINGEVEDRRAAIVAAMEQEAAARQTAIDAALSSVQSGVTEDATRQMIEDRVDIESDARNDAINAAVNALASGRQSLIDAAVGVERTARETALADAARQRDDAIATAIATEVNDRDNAIAAAISGEVQQRTSAIAVETAARTSAISEALAGEARKRTSSITAAVAAESDRRTADIEQIDRRVTASVAAVASGVRQDIETLSQRHSADVREAIIARDAAINSAIERERAAVNAALAGNVQTTVERLNAAQTHPKALKIFTRSTSYRLPANAKALLVRAAGAGGGGMQLYPAGGGLGTTAGKRGANTTVRASGLTLNMVAAGGNAGSFNERPKQNIGSSGGSVLAQSGSSGGKSVRANGGNYTYDGPGTDGHSGDLVQKFITMPKHRGASRLEIRIGQGGSAQAPASSGQDGYVEIWVW